jgi:hypothetical protein
MSKVLSSAEGRHYPERPVVGVGALIIEGSRILLVERGREPLRASGRCRAGRWRRAKRCTREYAGKYWRRRAWR